MMWELYLTSFCVCKAQTVLWALINTEALFYYWHSNTKIAVSVCTKQKNKWQALHLCTVQQLRSDDRKGAAFPLKQSQLIRVHGSQQGNFLAPPELLKTQILQHLWEKSTHYQKLISCMLALQINDACSQICNQLFAIKFSSMSSEANAWAWICFFFLAPSRNKTWKESIDVLLLLFLLCKMLITARLHDNQRDGPT